MRAREGKKKNRKGRILEQNKKEKLGTTTLASLLPHPTWIRLCGSRSTPALFMFPFGPCPQGGLLSAGRNTCTDMHSRK